MKRFEYRMEDLVYSIGSPAEEQLLEALNRFGQEGWRYVQTKSGLALPLSWKGGAKLLLEREIEP